MSPAERCDEIVRIIDELLGDESGSNGAAGTAHPGPKTIAVPRNPVAQRRTAGGRGPSVA